VLTWGSGGVTSATSTLLLI